MKVVLRANYSLEITPENDVEQIALLAWSERYFNEKGEERTDGQDATLLIYSLKEES
jgi:hypothetical protein